MVAVNIAYRKRCASIGQPKRRSVIERCAALIEEEVECVRPISMQPTRNDVGITVAVEVCNGCLEKRGHWYRAVEAPRAVIPIDGRGVTGIAIRHVSEDVGMSVVVEIGNQQAITVG
jgi:hypothetical protein